MKEIRLRRGWMAIVDDEDYEDLKNYSWYLSFGYARRSIAGNSPVLMHRQIMRPPKDMVVHHIDGDRLNNQKHNLQVLSKSENSSRPRHMTTLKTNVIYRRLSPLHVQH